MKKPRGRPPVDEKDLRRKTFTFRSRTTLYEKLSAAAGESQRSISEEIEFRLQRSFAGQEMMFDALEAIYGSGLAGMILIIGEIMKSSGTHAGFAATHTPQGAERWWTDPYAFDQAVKGAALALRAFAPAGEIVLPRGERTSGGLPEFYFKPIYERLGEGFARGVLEHVALSDSVPEPARALRLRRYLGETLVKRVKAFLERA